MVTARPRDRVRWESVNQWQLDSLKPVRYRPARHGVPRQALPVLVLLAWPPQSVALKSQPINVCDSLGLPVRVGSRYTVTATSGYSDLCGVSALQALGL